LLLSEAEAQALAAAARPPRTKREIGFVVIPVEWRRALHYCDHRDTRSVAWALLEQAGTLYRDRALFFTDLDARKLKVSRRGRMAALRELFELGLIALETRPGRGSAITLQKMG
jgi:hypothetical protein